MPKILNLTGQRFARLTVTLKTLDTVKSGATIWECLCDCGSVVYIPTGNLRSGQTRSCGCLQKEAVTKTNRNKVTHGLTDTPEYRIWGLIKDRCYNVKNKRYCDYGGRSISMSDEWKESFETFYQDMGPRPSEEHSIDRRENDKGYSKENCRWATKEEQANNTRRNLLIEFDGEKKTLAEWCRELTVSYPDVYRRINRGMEFEDAVDDVIRQDRFERDR